MKSVLLRLEGPLQSWGTQGRFSIRDTDSDPSKSGVLGMVGAALGMARDDAAELAVLATLRMAVRVDREGAPLRDYHTAGGGRFKGKNHEVYGASGTVLTDRHYLADASFLVALGSKDGDLVTRIARALQNPAWPIYLGRKSCVPSAPVFEGQYDGLPEDAVRRHKGSPLGLGGSAGVQEAEKLRLVLEADADLPGARPRNDVPVSFQLYGREHVRRFVVTDWVAAEQIRGKEG